MKYLLTAAAALAAGLAAASCAAGEDAPAGEAAMRVSHTQTGARVGEVRFPHEWIDGDPARKGHKVPDDFELPLNPQQLEVRKAPGAPEGEFLFRALEYQSDYEFEFEPDLPRPNYSRNLYAVDFDQGFRARPAAPEEWERAARVSRRPRLLVPLGGDHAVERGHSTRREVEYLGKKFASTGQYWHGATLSPGGRWLAVFSYSGRIPAPSFFDFLGGGGPRKGDVFWDVYDTVTGERVLQWQARGVSSPSWWNATALWIGDKYFVWDAAEDSRALVVATLPDFVPLRNPGEVRFPRWLAPEGSMMPAPASYVVRRPATDARELLFALRAEVEREVRYLTDDRPQREAVMRRRQTVYSTDFYAVSLDGEYRVRAATREEWQAAREVNNTRHEFSPDETYEYEGVRRRRHPPFPKSGASWGAPRALHSGMHWVAVFSYTDAPQGARGETAGAGGEAFVDVYERLTGLKMLGGRFAYTGSPAALFGGALWADESYLVVPADAASRSCLLWMLPETNRAR